MKRCTKCGEERPEEDFYRVRKGQPQRHSRCKDCCRQAQFEWAILNPDKRRAARKRNAKKAAEASKRWRAANPDLVKTYKQRDYDRHAEQYRQKSREWRRENPEQSKAHVNAWLAANPDAAKEMRTRANHRRRSLARDAYVEDVYPLVVLEMTDGMCGICGEDVDPLDFEFDHVIPLARGGEHAYYNVQPAHAACNRTKGAAL